MVSKAHCTKCGLKHVRPIGTRFNRILNQSVSVIAANLSDFRDSDDPDLPTPGQQPRSLRSFTTGSNNSQLQTGMDKKLDLLLERMEHLEMKNQQLKQKVKKQVSGHRQQLQLTDSSSDEDDAQLSIFSPSCTVTGHSSHSTAFEQSQLYLDFLKTDEKVQRKVQRQLERLQGSSIGNTISGTKTCLHRTGDIVVRQEIAWPYHYCFPGPGGQLPDYKDLSPIQFFVGFLHCLQEEKSNTIWSNMIDYCPCSTKGLSPNPVWDP